MAWHVQKYNARGFPNLQLHMIRAISKLALGKLICSPQEHKSCASAWIFVPMEVLQGQCVSSRDLWPSYFHHILLRTALILLSCN